MKENKDEMEKDVKKMTKSTKIMIAIIILLVAAVAVLSVILITGRNSDKKDNGTTEEVTTDTATPEDADSDTEEEADTEENIKTLCYVELTKGNGWDNNGKYSCQLDGYIYNDSDEDISDWEVRVDFASDFTLDSNWNGTYEINDNVLHITSVDYNETIYANQNINFGFIVTADSEEIIDNALGKVKLYVNGEEYTVTAESDTEEEKTESNQTEPSVPAEPESGTPVENHGKLFVQGTDIVDENGNKYQLKGVSTHGISWFPEYVNKEAFQTFRDDWDANLIRIAMYTYENGGYCTDGNKDELKNLVNQGVDYATELGMYVIIDWHVLNEQTPLTYKDEAISFFDEMSARYKDYENVIYEICNEPNGGTSWSDVKSYAEEVIPVIRANDEDAIIIVGTPTWSQDVDIAAEDPIEGYDNIMYAVHFYAATHTDNIRNKVKTAREAGLPMFVSEFSICDASGNGNIDYDQADKWFDLIDEYNLSYAGWNISNKDETSALIKSGCSKTSDWTDDELSETGIWLKNQIKGDN